MKKISQLFVHAREYGIHINWYFFSNEPKIVTHVEGTAEIQGEIQEILTTGSIILKLGCIGNLS